METTTQDIDKATARYAKALVDDLMAKKKIVKNQVEQQKTHKEVVLAFQDLMALRYQS